MPTWAPKDRFQLSIVGRLLSQTGFSFLPVIATVVLTILVAIFCGGPILFPDSVGYFHAGFSAWSHLVAVINPVHGAVSSLAAEEQDGISTARSVYYGLLYTGAYSAAGQWGLPVLQSILCGVAISLSLNRAGAAEAWRISAMAIFIALVAGLSIFCAAAMPDVFAGLMLLGVAMILTYSQAMGWLEYIFWLGLVFAACLFHRGHVAVLAVALAVLQFVTLGKKTRQIFILAGVVAVAVMAHIAVEVVVKDLSGRRPIQTPFLLARFVGDGTAKDFLQARCPEKRYELCRYANLMPMSENQFLWGDANRSVMGAANKAERERIAAEAPEIERGIVRMFPVRQSILAVKNIVTQFFDVGVRSYELGPTLDEDKPVTPLHQTIAQYVRRHVDQANTLLNVESSVIAAAYWIALFFCAAAILMRKASYSEQPELQLVVILLIGLVANAMVFGAISGVFDRYQGRLAWLPLLGLAMLLMRRETTVAAYPANSFTEIGNKRIEVR